MAVNPELAAANEISRVLLFPETSKVETFMKGRVELVEFNLRDEVSYRPVPGRSIPEIPD